MLWAQGEVLQPAMLGEHQVLAGDPAATRDITAWQIQLNCPKNLA